VEVLIENIAVIIGDIMSKIGPQVRLWTPVIGRQKIIERRLRLFINWRELLGVSLFLSTGKKKEAVYLVIEPLIQTHRSSAVASEPRVGQGQRTT